MKAISVRNPWAWAIVHAGKSIENRDWKHSFRGRVLIHAAKACTPREYGDACAFMFDRCGVAEVPELSELPRGAIIGAATVVDCVEDFPSPWFVGRYGFVLEDVRPSPVIVPCKGALGFFDVPADVAEQLRRAA